MPGTRLPRPLPQAFRPAGRRFPQGKSLQLVKKGFDKLVDGEASSPATTTLSSLR